MTLELVPVTTTPLADEIAELPFVQRGQLITRALEESKGWLALAVKGTDPAPLSEFKAWCTTVAEMTRAKGLAKAIQLDALEMVRRAERAEAQVILNGVAEGKIATRQEACSYAGKMRHAQRLGDTNSLPYRKPAPSDFVPTHELYGSGRTPGTMELAHGVSDELFEDAIAEARASQNMSRTQLGRTLRDKVDERIRRPRAERLMQIRRLAADRASSKEIAAEIGISAERVRELARQNNIEIPADRVMARVNTAINPAQVIRTTVEELAQSLEVTWSLLRPSDFGRLDPAETRDWIRSLDQSLRSLRRLKRELTRVH